MSACTTAEFSVAPSISASGCFTPLPSMPIPPPAPARRSCGCRRSAPPADRAWTGPKPSTPACGREQESRTLPFPEFKSLLREQFYILLLDQDGALAAIPKMLPRDAAQRRQAFDALTRILSARGPLDDEDQRRLARVAELFALDQQTSEAANVTALPSRDMRANAS